MDTQLSIWINGLSGSGKSTLALALKTYIPIKNSKVIVLDGDHLRKGLNKDLGFSAADRKENIRRAAELNLLLLEEGFTIINAFITPTKAIRTMITEIIGEARMYEIALTTPLSVCRQRDVKGLYRLVEEGKITNMTGIHERFESSNTANIFIDTSTTPLDTCIKKNKQGYHQF